MENEIKCPHCKRNNIVKRGYFKTEAHGKQQRYFCKDCNKKFIERTGFYKMKNSEKKITLCLDLFYRGISTRKVQEHLQAFYPQNSSHKSIYKWIVKYAKKISSFTDNIKLQVGKEIQVDEMEYHRRKSHKKGSKGIDKNWFIDIVDCKTRFMVSSEYVRGREKKELKKVIKRAKNKTDNQTKIVTTDGLTPYENVVKSVYGYYNLKKGLVKHNQVTASKGEGFNIMIERLHNNIRQRTKTFRGFHGSIDSANSIMKGFEIYYNFITKHQAINKCPYELAVPELKNKLDVNNKWLALIELATQNL